MPRITREDVEYVARLSHLDLDKSLEARLVEDLDRILGYIDQLNELDTDGVEPMMHVLDLTNVLREDVVEPSLNREESLGNAPNTDDEYFLVPRILDQD